MATILATGFNRAARVSRSGPAPAANRLTSPALRAARIAGQPPGPHDLDVVGDAGDEVLVVADHEQGRTRRRARLSSRSTRVVQVVAS